MNPEPSQSGSFPASRRLFTEADLRAAVEALYEAKDAGQVESKQDARSWLDGWLCEPYKSEGAPPPEHALERAAHAIYEVESMVKASEYNSGKWLHRAAWAALNAALNMTEEQQREAVGA